MRDFTNGEFDQNIERVSNLLIAYQILEDNDAIGDQARKDVLRASVVFLHSSLEEIVRNLFLHLLPTGSAESLNKIPFIGHETTHRPKEILLGHLKPHSGRFVENIIHESIEKYIDTMNINGRHQLTECLKMVNLPLDSLKIYLPPLDALMKRRHQIVHQMDRSNSLDPLEDSVTDIDITSVQEWRNILCEFLRELNKLSLNEK